FQRTAFESVVDIDINDIFQDHCRHFREIYCSFGQTSAKWMFPSGPLTTRMGDLWSGKNMISMKTLLVTKDNGNEGNGQQLKLYAKNSMDRFGDDMCGLILSYLSLEDKFRCECVSKQFQRTAFESVVDIDINDIFLKRMRIKYNSEGLTRIAKKCPNIQSIEFREIKSTKEEHILEVLNTFRANCRQLREIR
ncbi:unnamed protein product, partial [Medioppia subpectinata]